MFDIQREELDWCGRKLVLETGRIARQADGAVFATWGETSVLATVVAAKQPKPGQDFFPLTVHYQEKTFAAGRIPGGYLKREGRPSDRETLTSRLIDRPIRPLFPDGFRCDTQVIATVLSYDLESDSDILALVASSAALTLSGVPFMGPIGAARVGVIKGEVRVNPTVEEMKDSTLDLVVAGTADAVLMVESEAKELSEETMLKAVMAGHAAFQPVIAAIIRLAEKAAKEPRDLPANDRGEVEKAVLAVGEADLRAAYSLTQKQERYAAIDAAKAKVMAALAPEGGEAKFPAAEVAEAFHNAQAKVVRWNILDHGRRIDGRDLKTVRPILAQVGVLPRTHGSALFTRGETQALVVATLGTGEDEQYVDSLDGTYKERFLLHYNFPPYSVGETGRMGSPGRREIGHGKLAWRAIRPMLPTAAEFPYTIRVVSEITEFERLVVDGDGVRLLACADGRGRAAQAPDRRHRHGPHPRRRALRRPLRHPRRRGPSRRHGFQGRRHRRGRHLAADGHQDRRHHRGDHEGRARSGARRPFAHSRRDGQGDHRRPRRTRRIRSAHRDHENSDRQDPGSHRHGRQGDPRDRREDRRQDQHRGRRHGEDRLQRRRQDQGGDQLDQVDRLRSGGRPIYDGTVVKTVEFGAFVNFFGSKDGLVHISQLAKGRVAKTTDVVKEGDKVKVKVLGHDDRGKVKLSMRVVDQQTGADLEKAAGRRERGERRGGLTGRPTRNLGKRGGAPRAPLRFPPGASLAPDQTPGKEPPLRLSD